MNNVIEKLCISFPVTAPDLLQIQQRLKEDYHMSDKMALVIGCLLCIIGAEKRVSLRGPLFAIMWQSELFDAICEIVYA